MLKGQSGVEHSPARFRAPADLAWSSDGDPPRGTLNLSTNLNRIAERQAARRFDSQAAAAEVHQRDFAAIDQEL